MQETNKLLDKYLHEISAEDKYMRRTAARELGKLRDPTAVEHLIKELKTTDLSLKKEIIRSLKEINDYRAIKPLLDLFNVETSNKVKARIAWALSHFIDDDFDITILIRALDDDNEYLKLGILLVLGIKKHTKCIPKLIELFKKESKINIRKKIIWALGQMNDKKALKPLLHSLNDPSHKIRRKSASVLARLPYTKTKISELVEMLDNKEHFGRAEIIHILGWQTSNLCVPKLIEIFEDELEPFLIRKNAIKVLGKLKDARAYKTLANAINDPSQSIRAIAIQSLNYDHNLDDKTLQNIIDAIFDDYKIVRKTALGFIRALIGSSYYPIELADNIPKLIDLLLSDIDDNERAEIAIILSRIRDERIIEPFQKVVKNYSGRAKLTAFHTLEKMGFNLDLQPFFDDLNNPSIDVRRNAFTIMNYSEQLSKYKELIREGLCNEKHCGHLELIFLLRKERPEYISEALINIAKNSTDQLTRQEAIWRVVSDKSSKVIELLKELTNDEDEKISKSAMYLLHTNFPTIKINRQDVPTKIEELFPEKKKKKRRDISKEDKRDVLKLIDLLQNDSNRIIRWRAAVALAKHTEDERIIKPLISSLGESFTKIRKAAVFALGKIENTQVVEPIIAALQDPSRKVRQLAAFALRAFLKENTPEDRLIKELAVKDHIGRTNILGVLSRNDFRKCIPSIIEIVMKDHDFKVRHAAIYSVYYKRDERLASILVEALNDPVREVRSAALSVVLYGPHDMESVKDNLIQKFKDKTSFGRYETFYRLCSESPSKTLVSTDFIKDALYDENFYIKRIAINMFGFHNKHHLIPKDYNKVRKTSL